MLDAGMINKNDCSGAGKCDDGGFRTLVTINYKASNKYNQKSKKTVLDKDGE